MEGDFGAIKILVNLANDHEFAKFSPSKYFASEENSKLSLELNNFLLNQGLLHGPVIDYFTRQLAVSMTSPRNERD